MVMINMTENKRYTTDNGSNEDVCLVDNVTGKEFESDFDEIVDLVNEQEAEIKRLEDELQNLQTFKKVLEFAEKDMEERADWQAYCEKEFEGL